MENKPIVTRFAPSPTGLLHGGNYRTALFCYLIAKKNNGKFHLRIEDTDKARSKKEYEDNILETLAWMGLKHDDFARQSERAPKQREYIKKLVDEGKAYVSKETPKEPGGREEVIRFKNPNKKVTFTDLIRGDITFDTTDLGDFIIAKSFDEPVFHLAVVADDFDMGVTHIFRGEDHISNTPRHILIQEALGAPTPVYAHLPLVLAADRSKLSKRKGALPLTAYRDRGILPEAMINFLAMIGWNPGDNREIFTIDELINEFKIERVQKSGAIFNEEKLLWLNKEHMKKLSADKLIARAKKTFPDTEETFLLRLIPLAMERSLSLNEFDTNLAELAFFFTKPTIDTSKIIWKEDTKENAKKHLEATLELVTKAGETDFGTTEQVKAWLFPYAEANGKGNVLWPLRYGLSGKDKSPDPFTIISVLGKAETVNRLTSLIETL